MTELIQSRPVCNICGHGSRRTRLTRAGCAGSMGKATERLSANKSFSDKQTCCMLGKQIQQCRQLEAQLPKRWTKSKSASARTTRPAPKDKSFHKADHVGLRHAIKVGVIGIVNLTTHANSSLRLDVRHPIRSHLATKNNGKMLIRLREET